MDSTHLASLTQNYVHREKVLAHLTALTERHASLVPQPSDQADAPCCCRGSLPITFQGQLYHIPLGIWIPSGYPQETPRVFVLPSKQMKIRTSSSVDSNGRVTHPYLNIWPEYSEANLVQLCAMLQASFSQDPPLVMRTDAEVAGESTTDTPVPSEAALSGDPFSQAAQMHSPLDYRAIFGSNQTSVEQTSDVVGEEMEHTNAASTERAALLRIAEEKMKQRILAFHQEADEKINQVLADHAKLVEHAAKIDAAHARLVSIEMELNEEMTELLDKARQLAASVDALRAEDDFTKEEMVKGETPLHEQIFTLAAKDLAIDDTIDQLSAALRQNHVDLATYLKMVRRLAREQFNCKALLAKARVCAGLDA